MCLCALFVYARCQVLCRYRVGASKIHVLDINHLLRIMGKPFIENKSIRIMKDQKLLESAAFIYSIVYQKIFVIFFRMAHPTVNSQGKEK